MNTGYEAGHEATLEITYLTRFANRSSRYFKAACMSCRRAVKNAFQNISSAQFNASTNRVKLYSNHLSLSMFTSLSKSLGPNNTIASIHRYLPPVNNRYRPQPLSSLRVDVEKEKHPSSSSVVRSGAAEMSNNGLPLRTHRRQGSLFKDDDFVPKGIDTFFPKKGGKDPHHRKVSVTPQGPTQGLFRTRLNQILVSVYKDTNSMIRCCLHYPFI